MSSEENCPTHGAECPGHFHVEIPAEGPGVARLGNAVYIWPTDTPAKLPQGDMADMEGWQQIGWVDEIHVDIRPRLEEFEAAYRKVEQSFRQSREAMKTQASMYAEIFAQQIDPDFASDFFETVAGPKPDYALIDLDKVKWTATPDKPRPAEHLDLEQALGVTLVPWQADLARQWTVEGAVYRGILNEIRALTPPADWDDVLAEVKRLHTETPLTRIDAATLVRERMAITGQPYSIINDNGANYAAYEMQALHAYQKGKNK